MSAGRKRAFDKEQALELAMQVQQILQRYRDLREIIAILGIDELSDEDRLSWRVPGAFSSS